MYNMKSFEMVIMENVNVSRLKEILSGLEKIGCSIELFDGKYRVTYEDALQEDVKSFFDTDYRNNVKLQ